MTKSAMAAKRFRRAEATLERLREEMHDAIRADHDGGNGLSVRALARETGYTYGRIGQIVRSER